MSSNSLTTVTETSLIVYQFALTVLEHFQTFVILYRIKLRHIRIKLLKSGKGKTTYLLFLFSLKFSNVRFFPQVTLCIVAFSSISTHLLILLMITNNKTNTKEIHILTDSPHSLILTSVYSTHYDDYKIIDLCLPCA